MDNRRFDRITRVLGGSVDRRVGLRIVAAVAAAAFSGLVIRNEDVAAKPRQRRVSAQGPCGNGGAKANACKKDNDCCTKFCDKKKGRCRCRKLGQPCAIGENCCATFGQPMICQDNICATVGAAPPPPICPGLGQTCTTAGAQCCPGIDPNVVCGTGLAPNKTCQNCNLPPTAEGALCQVPQGNQCCGGNVDCFVAIRLEDDQPVCLNEDSRCRSTPSSASPIPPPCDHDFVPVSGGGCPLNKVCCAEATRPVCARASGISPCNCTGDPPTLCGPLCA